jgi:hypothetical protein
MPTNQPPQLERRSLEFVRGLQARSRYVFKETEFAAHTGREAGSVASQMALQRLAKSNFIALAQKKPAFWLIVPPEQAHYGAPPADWWLHDLMQELEPAYYVALLSAARHWGSSHYAYQHTQVMVSRPRRPLTPGKLRVDFIVKKQVQDTPVVLERNRVARMRVSSREATLLDLIRHQSTVGGLEAVARIAHDLAPKMTSDSLQQALEALGQVPAAQRCGFILDRLGHTKLAEAADVWLRKQKVNRQRLTPELSEGQALVSENHWRIDWTPAQHEILREVAG